MKSTKQDSVSYAGTADTKELFVAHKPFYLHYGFESISEKRYHTIDDLCFDSVQWYIDSSRP